MTRRDALLATGVAVSFRQFRSSAFGADTNTPRSPFLLSSDGCGRATGYAESNKIVTFGDRTHVSWLDSPPEGFRVRARTFDRASGSWTPTVTIGDAYDNHGGPALTIDSDGFLHIVYYPHHHAMRYRKSRSPNDATEWEDEISFGDKLTYPTLVCGRDNTLYLTARRSFPDRPWHVELWKRSPGQTWQHAGVILQSRHRGYSHFQESLAWSPDHRTLHLCCRFHEKTDEGGYGRLQTVAYLVSRDAGHTWQHSDGTTVALPVTAESAEVLATGGVDHERTLRAGAMAVDAEGRAFVVYSVEEHGRSQLVIAHPRGNGTWQQIDLTRFLPDEWASWNLVATAGMTFTAENEMVVTAQIQQPTEGESTWGNGTNEVVAFCSRDAGRTFSFSLVSTPDSEESHWLPNIERSTGHHTVPVDPHILYTAGGPGDGNSDLLSNRVLVAAATRD